MLIQRLSRSRFLSILMFLALLALSALPLAADAGDSDVFASIRIYDGVDPADMAEITELVQDGFLPIVQDRPGFIAYFLLPAGDTLVAFNIFASEVEASASNAAAADFVAEFMAPLLPNAPKIFEGSIEVGALNVMDKDWPQLYASIRLYDGFDTSRLDSFVSIVREGFLPLMTGSDGFYAYFLLNDGAGEVAAISIFESEAASLASNDQARDFVAENLADYLPNNPAINSGQLSVAGRDLGNFAKYVLGKGTFISVRVYEGLDPADQPEISRQTREGFLPIIRESDGFVGYYMLNADDMLATVSLFDSAEQASASNEAAADFIAENAAHMVPNPPLVIEGTGDIDFVASADELPMTAAGAPLYASLRVYSGFDIADLAGSRVIIESEFIPIQQEAGGLFAYLTMTDGVDKLVAFSVYDSEENALAVVGKAAAFVADRLADVLPNNPLRVNGRLGAAALAAVEMGANLAAG